MRKAQRGSTQPLRRILILVQNLPVPFDRRVWLEANALRDAGFQVSIVCPKGPGDPAYQELEGIRIRKYPLLPEATGTIRTPGSSRTAGCGPSFSSSARPGGKAWT